MKALSVDSSRSLQMALIRNRRQLIGHGRSALDRRARRLCLHTLEDALRAIRPSRCLESWLKVTDGQLMAGDLSIHLSRTGRIMLLSVGKASVSMMAAALKILSSYEISGVLVAPRGETAARMDDRIEIFHSGHPMPDSEGVRAAQHVISGVSNLHVNDLLLCLISGGASAMLPAPPAEITLEDKTRVTELLIRSRATIHEINTVRRHMSKLKGGGLARICKASKILSFIISDVPGNSLPDIASGLTAADPTTYDDAVGVLTKYDLWKKIPHRVANHLRKGLSGQIPETPKPGSTVFQGVHNFVIADNRTACTAAKNAMKRSRIPAKILSSRAETDARSMGRILAALAIDSKRFSEPIRSRGAIIVGGETTVDLKGRGLGGRNQETALSAVEQIAGLEGAVIAALGTDGIDGNSRAAGAIVDGDTARRAGERKMDVQDFLVRNDSYRFFKKLGDNIITGRTGTNVGDLYLLLLLR